MLRRVQIWPIHYLPFLKPACSRLILVSMAVSIRLKRTLQNTLPGIDRRVIPHQFSQFLMLRFLGTLTIRPLDQSSGMVSLFQMCWNRSVGNYVDVRMSALSISAWIASMPYALPLFRVWMATLTSAESGGLVLISRISPVVVMLAGCSGSGRLST